VGSATSLSLSFAPSLRLARSAPSPHISLRPHGLRPGAVGRSRVTLWSDRRGLYEPTEPNQQGLLPVDDTHSLFYHVYGNSTSQHVALSLHGGPGAGSFPRHARFFDPKRCRVVLFDQRGCGSSTPRGSIDNNDTPNLIADIERLRVHLNVSTWDIVLGGSWGSTLALAYSQEYPERVRAMVLRGVCLMRAKEICWLFGPEGGCRALLPRAYKEFVSDLLEHETVSCKTVLEAYSRRLFSSNTTTQGAAARRWLSWEYSVSSLHQAAVLNATGTLSASSVVEWDGSRWLVDGKDEEELKAEARRRSSVTLTANTSKTNGNQSRPAPSAPYVPAQAMLTCWYSLHGGFLEEEAILQPQRMERIRHIPCIAVQGAADYICPPWTALDLHEAWPEMKLRLVAGAGHSMYDPEITSELVKATDFLLDRHTSDSGEGQEEETS